MYGVWLILSVSFFSSIFFSFIYARTQQASDDLAKSLHSFFLSLCYTGKRNIFIRSNIGISNRGTAHWSNNNIWSLRTFMPHRRHREFFLKCVFERHKRKKIKNEQKKTEKIGKHRKKSRKAYKINEKENSNERKKESRARRSLFSTVASTAAVKFLISQVRDCTDIVSLFSLLLRLTISLSLFRPYLTAAVSHLSFMRLSLCLALAYQSCAQWYHTLCVTKPSDRNELNVFTNTKHYNGFCSYLNEITANQS